MKSFLVIGAGTFGHHLCRELSKQKCEVMVVDRNPKPLEDLVNIVTSAKIADCASIETLRLVYSSKHSPSTGYLSHCSLFDSMPSIMPGTHIG